MGILIALFTGTLGLFTAFMSLYSMFTLNIYGVIGYATITLFLWVIAIVAAEWE